MIEAKWDRARQGSFTNFFAEMLLVYYLVLARENQRAILLT